MKTGRRIQKFTEEAQWFRRQRRGETTNFIVALFGGDGNISRKAKIPCQATYSSQERDPCNFLSEELLLTVSVRYSSLYKLYPSESGIADIRRQAVVEVTAVKLEGSLP